MNPNQSLRGILCLKCVSFNMLKCVSLLKMRITPNQIAHSKYKFNHYEHI